MTTYPWIGLRADGLQRQIHRLSEELARLDIEVLLLDPWTNQVDDSDILHVFGLDASVLRHVRHARMVGVPVIVSPISLDPFQRRQLRLKALLARLPQVYSAFRAALELLELATVVVCLNEDERAVVRSLAPATASRCRIVPNGVDVRASGATSDRFEETYGAGPFVSYVGRIEPAKGQHHLIEAAGRISSAVAIVGSAPVGQRSYELGCRAKAPDNVLFTGHLADRELVESMYAASHVVVLLSEKEVQPLVLDEGYSAGCRLVVSKDVPLRGEFDPVTEVVTRLQPEHISAAVNRALLQPRNSGVTPLPTWEAVALELRELYIGAVSGTQS